MEMFVGKIYVASIMSDQTASVVIVGAGIVGASVAYHLAARGCKDVLILEREDTPIAGSTSRAAAGVRHQFGNEINILMSKYSIERLAHFEEEIGGHAELKKIGYLLLVDNPQHWGIFERQVALQNKLGVRTQIVSMDDVLRMVPGTKTDDLVGATFGPDDGFCDPHGVASGYLHRARELGARLQLSTRVTGFEIGGARVKALKTNQGVIHCDTVVNAAGAWSGQLGTLAGLDVPVIPERHTIFMTEPFAPYFDHTIPFTFDVTTGFHMRQEQRNILIGYANPNEPSSESIDVDWSLLDSALDAGIQRFPILEQAALAQKLCWAGLYEVTPDHMPILGRHPDLPNYVSASGFSGHGVMHSPATGMLIAEEILDGRAHTINIDDLRITRFKERPIHAEANVF
jgi:sarcosine oxidase subunit beta